MGLLTDLFANFFTPYARLLVLQTLSRITYGKLKLVLKDTAPSETRDFGNAKQYGPDTPESSLVVLDKNIWFRLCLNLDVGFAEAYMRQQVECENLVELFSIYIKNWTTLGHGSYFLQIIPRILRFILKPTNDIKNSLQNASSHYDTSNELFQAFLSPDMSYSCALWSGDPSESLESAQRGKVHNIIRKARISPGDHILDIGGGWGFLAIEAVKLTNCRVTAITLSKEQKALAEENIRKAGFSDKIEFLLCDYRDTPRPEGGYDRVVSVEMVEHVGKEHMDTFFASISRLLRPNGGLMVVQGITIINELHDSRANLDNFIDTYIFPGGYLPSVNRLVSSLHAGSRGKLEVESVSSIGPHYVKTLRLWREKFCENWPRIRASYTEGRPDLSEEDIEAFRRRWIYYFCYCEAGFRARILGDHVISAVKTPEPNMPAEVPL